MSHTIQITDFELAAVLSSPQKIEITKSSARYYSHRYRRDVWFPVWVVNVDGRPIVGNCGNAFTTRRAALAEARKLTARETA